MAREALVDERVARGQQCPHVLVVEEHAAQEQPDLLGEVLAQRVSELGEQQLVGLDRVEILDVQPAQSELVDEHRGSRVLEHAPDLLVQDILLRQLAGGGEAEQRVVGALTP